MPNDGQIQLERILNQLLEAGFQEKDIELVVGFQAQKMITFLKAKNFKIKVKINANWKKTALMFFAKINHTIRSKNSSRKTNCFEDENKGNQ